MENGNYQRNRGQIGHYRARPVEDAPWSDECLVRETCKNSEAMIDEILARVAWHGSGRSAPSMRALLQEQLDAKIMAARVIERVIENWNDDTLRNMVARFPVEAESTRIFPDGARGGSQGGSREEPSPSRQNN